MCQYRTIGHGRLSNLHDWERRRSFTLPQITNPVKQVATNGLMGEKRADGAHSRPRAVGNSQSIPLLIGPLIVEMASAAELGEHK